MLDDVLRTLREGAERAVAAGIPADRVLVDPTLDFGKTTAHSLTLLRHTEAIVALGFPVLQALSRKDFVGETLDLPTDERLEGTLAATAVAAWLGATVFRAHDVRATRRVVDMVASIRGDRAARVPSDRPTGATPADRTHDPAGPSPACASSSWAASDPTPFAGMYLAELGRRRRARRPTRRDATRWRWPAGSDARAPASSSTSSTRPVGPSSIGSSTRPTSSSRATVRAWRSDSASGPRSASPATRASSTPG